MRANVKIVGYGKRMSGTGKTGKPYDFQSISFLFTDSYTIGECAATTSVDGSILGDYLPTVGDNLDIVYHKDFKSGRVYVDAIL